MPSVLCSAFLPPQEPRGTGYYVLWSLQVGLWALRRAGEAWHGRTSTTCPGLTKAVAGPRQLLPHPTLELGKRTGKVGQLWAGIRTVQWAEQELPREQRKTRNSFSTSRRSSSATRGQPGCTTCHSDTITITPKPPFLLPVFHVEHDVPWSRISLRSVCVSYVPSNSLCTSSLLTGG